MAAEGGNGAHEARSDGDLGGHPVAARSCFKNGPENETQRAGGRHVSPQHSMGGVQGAQPPAFLETREQVHIHESGTRRNGVRTRTNPWTKESQERAEKANERSAEALVAADLPIRAAKVRMCRKAITVARSPVNGQALRSRAGIGTAVTHKCGWKLCTHCAADSARRARRVIEERLHEIDARAKLEGPLRHRTRFVHVPGSGELTSATSSHELNYGRPQFDDEVNGRRTAGYLMERVIEKISTTPGFPRRLKKKLHGPLREHVRFVTEPVEGPPNLPRHLRKQLQGPRLRRFTLPYAAVLLDAPETEEERMLEAAGLERRVAQVPQIVSRQPRGQKRPVLRRMRHVVVSTFALDVVTSERRRTPPLMPRSFALARIRGYREPVEGTGKFSKRRQTLMHGPRRLVSVADVEVHGPAHEENVPTAACAVDVGHEDGRTMRRTLETFRIGLPPTTTAYGARHLVLSQPARAGEGLEAAIERLEDALRLFTRSPTWSAHVDAAVIRIEFELSTPDTREKKAIEHGRAGDAERARELRSRKDAGEWWHVHAHVIYWGTYWPMLPSEFCKCTRNEHAAVPAYRKRSGKNDARERCHCTQCVSREGANDEASLMLTWRRALVSTRLYDRELADAGTDSERVIRALRREGHAKRGGHWAPALDGIRIGRAYVKTPPRTKNGHRLSPTGAVAEVVKYACKSMNFATMEIDRIVEVIKATAGRRLIRCTGLLYGVQLPEDDEEATLVTEGVDVEYTADDDGKGRRGAWDEEGNFVPESEFVWCRDADALEERRALNELTWQIHEDLRAPLAGAEVEQ